MLYDRLSRKCLAVSCGHADFRQDQHRLRRCACEAIRLCKGAGYQHLSPLQYLLLRRREADARHRAGDVFFPLYRQLLLSTPGKADSVSRQSRKNASSSARHCAGKLCQEATYKSPKCTASQSSLLSAPLSSPDFSAFRGSGSTCPRIDDE